MDKRGLAIDDWKDRPRGQPGNKGQFAEISGGAASGKQDITKVLGKEHTGVKGQAAVDLLLKEKNGHVKGAFYRKKIGHIDLAWGDDKFGLQHIIKERKRRKQDVDTLLSSLSSVINNGTISTESRRGEQRYIITLGGKKASITKNLRGTQTICVLTAYEAN